MATPADSTATWRGQSSPDALLQAREHSRAWANLSPPGWDQGGRLRVQAGGSPAIAQALPLSCGAAPEALPAAPPQGQGPAGADFSPVPH